MHFYLEAFDKTNTFIKACYFSAFCPWPNITNFPANGNVVGPEITVLGDRLQIVCNDKYVTANKKYEIKCLESGEWNMLPPHCKGN